MMTYYWVILWRIFELSGFVAGKIGGLTVVYIMFTHLYISQSARI
jgi:hypothetical protein